MKARRFTVAGFGAAIVTGLLVAIVSCSDAPADAIALADAAAAASTLTAFAATPCGACIAERCAPSRAACSADPSCAARLGCLEACPLAPGGSFAPDCTSMCPAAQGSTASALATAYDRCRDEGPGLACVMCPGRAWEPPIDPPPFAETCPASAAADADACLTCASLRCCASADALRGAPGYAAFATCSAACTSSFCGFSCLLAGGPALVSAYDAYSHCLDWRCLETCGNASKSTCDTCMRDRCPREFLAAPTPVDRLDALLCAGRPVADSGARTCPDLSERTSAYDLCRDRRCADACP